MCASLKIHSAYEETQILKTKHILAYHEFSCTTFFKPYFGYFYKLFVMLSIAVNEVNVHKIKGFQ